jgi:ribonuclease BN (tRNA processing enzyme)/tetratricopeptide (TPR) repeat protein
LHINPKFSKIRQVELNKEYKTVSDKLDNRSYSSKIKELTEVLYNTYGSAASLAYRELISTIHDYLQNENNVNIKSTAGVVEHMEQLISNAKKFAEIEKVAAFDLIYNIGYEYFSRAYYSTALQLYKVASSIASEDQSVNCVCSIAELYEEVGDIDKSISCLDYFLHDSREKPLTGTNCSRLKSLQAKIGLNNRLFDVKSEDTRYTEILNIIKEQAESAILHDSNNPDAYYTSGLVLERIALHQKDTINKNREYDQAIAALKKAVELCENLLDKRITDTITLLLASTYLALGRVYESLKKTESNADALNTYLKALSLLTIKEEALGYPIYRSIVSDHIAQLQSKIKEDINNQGFSKETENIMKSSDMALLEKQYYENKRIRKNFIREWHRLKIASPPDPKLYILQKWNSFTPILSDDTSPSKGGGYFLSIGYTGVVFDPGFDFIQNFRNAGLSFNNIDCIFITHAHNDHTADLESLLSLLHDYNKEIKGDKSSSKENCIFRKMMSKYPHKSFDEINTKVDEMYINSPRRKIFRIYVSAGTKEKCGFLKLGSKTDYELVILNTEQAQVGVKSFAPNKRLQIPGGVDISYGNKEYGDKWVTIYPIPAKHDDTMTDRDCYGYVIRFHHDNTIIWYTGDTGFSEELQTHYIAMNNYLGQNKQTILLAHIGGFKPNEQYYFRTDATKAYYPNHLGRLGLCKIFECIKPDVLLVSEFGEEFRNCRADLVKIFKKTYMNTSFSTVILPLDVGFTLDFRQAPKSIEAHYQLIVLTNNKETPEIPINQCAFSEEDIPPEECYIKYSARAAPLV